MTDQQIKEQIEVIDKVTRDITTSKEKAAAFLQSAGIASTPRIKNDSNTSIRIIK